VHDEFLPGDAPSTKPGFGLQPSPFPPVGDVKPARVAAGQVVVTLHRRPVDEPGVVDDPRVVSGLRRPPDEAVGVGKGI
jgi:hypothetical protein